MEMVTKVVPVRAVELSIGAFCTEFRCEQLCDDDVFGIGVQSLSDSNLRFSFSVRTWSGYPVRQTPRVNRRPSRFVIEPEVAGSVRRQG